MSRHAGRIAAMFPRGELTCTHVSMSPEGQTAKYSAPSAMSGVISTPDVNHLSQLTSRLAFLFVPCRDIPCRWQDRFCGPVLLAA
jgi:hypothetical protein